MFCGGVWAVLLFVCCCLFAVEGQTEIYVCANHQSTYIMLLKRYKVKQVCKIALHSSRAQFDVGFSMMGILVVKFDFRVVFNYFNVIRLVVLWITWIRCESMVLRGKILLCAYHLYYIEIDLSIFLGGRVVIKFSRWILW